MSRGQNPETPITNQIRNLLSIMRIPHRKHWAGPMSDKGISDIIGTIPGPTTSVSDTPGGITFHPAGRGLWIEVKTPTGKKRPEQIEFIEQMRAAGALAFFADDPRVVIRELAAAGYEPATRIDASFPPKPKEYSDG